MRDDDVVETAATPTVSGMADLSGSAVAGRYRLADALGHGAMANVYRAVDDRLERDVAVKLFHAGQDMAVRWRFGAEAQALARLSHPGLVGIYDAGVEGDRPYLVMELVDGESLRDRLLGGPLNADEVVLLGARLSLALAHVHGNGVVHRDVKPSNIVLDGNGSPHLADFGIALLLDAARVTTSNEIMGTAAYLSPEQILGVDVGSAADIYSLGLVLLECVTGELEYPGVSRVESALARLHRSPRMPDGMPAVLRELLTAMTAREPGDRPTAGDCAAWFWAVKERGAAADREMGFVAAEWLSKKGKELGASRAKAPLFSGWRRFAIAGSGLAMAILASTWLFTSILPKVMPAPPAIGEGLAPPTSVSNAPEVEIQHAGTGMHVAAVQHTPGHATLDNAHARTTPALPPVTSDDPVITSTINGPTVTGTPTTVPTSPDQLQDTTVNDGPNSSPDTTDTTSSGSPGTGDPSSGPPSSSGEGGSDGQGGSDPSGGQPSGESGPRTTTTGPSPTGNIKPRSSANQPTPVMVAADPGSFGYPYTVSGTLAQDADQPRHLVGRHHAQTRVDPAELARAAGTAGGRHRAPATCPATPATTPAEC
ncbi:MAG TPA: serine/threonine-protein kinase [Pseudonocardiaceae bacterium]|nr:serine/threonine-protein kinase [Pseudonocardiaceae bacterium]